LLAVTITAQAQATEAANTAVNQSAKELKEVK